MERIDSIISKSINDIEVVNRKIITGIPSGLIELDKITGGWQKSELIVLGGRPAMGKTSFALNVARNAAVDFNKSVAVFTYEMSSSQFLAKLISSEVEIPSSKLKRGNLEDYELQQINDKIVTLAKAPVFINSNPGNISQVCDKARILKHEQNVELLIIDYLQLITIENDNFGNRNREQEISYIIRNLKALVKELDIPIIILSQLNRSIETRGGMRHPQLSDLRESGSIEQDADMVIFLHRPEYYNIFEDEFGNSTSGIAELIIAKHRHGTIGSANVRFVSEYTKFTDLKMEDADFKAFAQSFDPRIKEDHPF